MSIWLFFIINIVAAVWNSYAAGILWESDDGLLNRILAGTVLVAAFVGFTYAFILAAIGLGYTRSPLSGTSTYGFSRSSRSADSLKQPQTSPTAGTRE